MMTVTLPPDQLAVVTRAARMIGDDDRRQSFFNQVAHELRQLGRTPSDAEVGRIVGRTAIKYREHAA